MSMFAGMSTQGHEAAEDRLGGFHVFESDAYLAKIKMAYGIQSASGAKGAVLIFDIGGKEYRETVYATNKKGENFYVKNDKTFTMPGYTLLDDLALIVTGKEIGQLAGEERVVKVYNTETKKDENKSVPALVELIDGEVLLLIKKSTVNKQVKNGNDYVATAETREENSITKAADPASKRTVVEAKEGKEPEFVDAWLKKNQGKTFDERTLKDGQSGAPKAGAPAAGGSAPKPASSLFGK